MALLGSLWLFTGGVQAQRSDNAAWADSVLTELSTHKQADAHKAAELARRIMPILDRSREPCKALHARTLLANYLDRLGVIDSAAALFMDARFNALGGCPATVQKDYYRFLTNVYLSMNEFARVDSLCASCYEHAKSGPLSTADLSDVRCNHAIAMANMGRMEEAMALFQAVYEEAQVHGSMDGMMQGLNNMATIHAMMGELPEARDDYARALAISRKGGFSDHIMLAYQNLGSVMIDLGDHKAGFAYLDSAIRMARRSGNAQGEADAVRELANLLRHQEATNPAYDSLFSYMQKKETILNSDRIKAVADMREKYETEKKERDNEELRATNLESQLTSERLRRTRNIYLFSGIVVVGLAVGLWNRLRFVHRSRAAIQREKEVSEGLLHNILPEEVADELRAKGYADARQFDKATVLFTDFKGFTQLSEHLTATELVAEIDHCFKAFDGIIEAHGIEKIKTIGDAYMAAGGLPDTGRGSPASVVRAALDLQAFMATYKAQRESEGRLFFEMRVGLNTGTVVAGIVGVKKFAYDIWGDTVNTASRMESSGVTGRVNISRSTYELVRDESDLIFTERGMKAAKGKGEMEMWFVDRVANPTERPAP